MASLLTSLWEIFGDYGSATHRFTATSNPPTLSLSQLIDDTVTLAAGATVTVWDTATSPLPNFDFLYLHAAAAIVDIELSWTVSAATTVKVLRLAANGFPFVLNDDTAFLTLGGTAGLLTKVRAFAPATNTVAATLRYGVGVA